MRPLWQSHTEDEEAVLLSPCSDIVLDERYAKARAKHAEARKVYVERNRKGPL